MTPAGKSGALIAGLCFSLLAGAQTRPDAGTILETIKPPPAPPRQSPGLELPPPPRPALPALPGPRVQVGSFRVVGATLFSADRLQALLEPFVGQALDFAGLNAAAEVVTGFYRGQGYFLAQAYLPRQDLQDGIVEIYVMEGRIGKVDVQSLPGARLRSAVAAGYLQGIQPGDSVHEATIERPLLLLQDLPGVAVRSTIGPGAKPGEADLAVDVGDDGRPVTGVLEVENFGTKSAGQTRIGGQVFVNNPLGLGDQLTVRGLVAEDTLTEVAGLAYLLPVGDYGTRLGLNATRLHYDLEGGRLVDALRPSGDGFLYSFLAVHPLVRRQDLTVYGQLAFEHKNLEDRTVATTDKRELRSVTASMFGDWRDAALGGGFNSYVLNFTAGDHKPTSQYTIATDSLLQESGNYAKFYLEFKRLQRLADAWQAFFLFSHQGASKNLASVEKFSASGPYAVRAYPVGEVLANEATLLTAELRYTIPRWNLLGGDFTLAAFYDVADLKRYKNQPVSDINLASGQPNPNQRTLDGAGLGLRWGKAGSFAFVADFAWRLQDPPLTDSDRKPRVWLHAIKWF